MPIELKIWKLEGTELKPEPVSFGAPELESHLEDAIVQDLSIVAPGLMFLGRQVPTAWGKFIDILALDGDGHLIVIELKRDKTPREVVAQVLDYGSWVQSLSYDDIVRIFAEKNAGKAFESTYEETFGAAPPDTLNAGHRLIVVAARLDSETERIINYLTDNYGVPINAVFFGFFKENGNTFLARTWLLDPQHVEAQATKSSSSKNKASEAWNGSDFYVNVLQDSFRHWEDCCQYGFISAGGGKWYSRSLQLLSPGGRVFAYLPSYDGHASGYAGVGIVTGEAVPATQWKVPTPDGDKPLLSLPLKAKDMGHDPGDLEKCEYVVPIRWVKTVPREEAYREKGMFANQNSVCRLSNSFTIDKLTRYFGLEDLTKSGSSGELSNS